MHFLACRFLIISSWLMTYWQLLLTRYKHLGQFAPLGGEQAAAELPGDWVSMGHSTQWLWYSVYASKQVSWRTRVLVVFDWTRRFIFGRDSSRIWGDNSNPSFFPSECCFLTCCRENTAPNLKGMLSSNQVLDKIVVMQCLLLLFSTICYRAVPSVIIYYCKSGHC